MNIHRMHFQQGIKPRLRSSRAVQSKPQTQAQESKETFQNSQAHEPTKSVLSKGGLLGAAIAGSIGALAGLAGGVLGGIAGTMAAPVAGVMGAATGGLLGIKAGLKTGDENNAFGKIIATIAYAGAGIALGGVAGFVAGGALGVALGTTGGIAGAASLGGVYGLAGYGLGSSIEPSFS